MHFLIQNSTYTEEGWEQFITNLNLLKIPYTLVDQYSWKYTIDLTLKSIPNNFIPIGTKEFILYGLKNNWPNIYGTQQDYSYSFFSKYFLSEMLNSDFICKPFQSLNLTNKAWVREDDGYGSFKGQIVTTDTYNLQKPLSQLFVTASLKEIAAEYRIFVINNQVISSSCYMLGGNFTLFNTDDETVLMSYAQKVVDQSKFPLETFVMDVAIHNYLYKVLEINCVNCSGWYAVNSLKVLKALTSKDD